MKAALTRDRALRGARILASDPGLQRSLGIGILNAESRTGDELHDEWRWQRSDMGLAFDQMSGRNSAPSTLTTRVHGSLRRPKAEVTFSFKRKACPGFTRSAKVELSSCCLCCSKDLPLCTPENIKNFISQECTPDRLTVVGVNVDFQELCKWTARSFAEQGHLQSVASGGGRELQPAKYTGGEVRMARPNPLAHLIFGWEVPGGWNGKWLAAATVLQMFLGGGGSFSTGGPGKGMHTRLYTEVLNRHHWAESCQASTVMYIDSGLFTVYATVVPQFGSEFHNVLARIFEGVPKISDTELTRAKNALKSSIHMNLEMRAVMMEDMGRQMVLSGKVGTAQEFTRMVDSITRDRNFETAKLEDLVEVLRLCLKSPTSFVAFGAIEKVCPYENIAKRFSDIAL
eukprot:g2256.t1